MAKKGIVGVFMMFTVVIFMIIGIFGYFMNLSKFIKCDFESPYKAEVLRGVGIGIPLIGAVEGYITITDGEPHQN